MEAKSISMSTLVKISFTPALLAVWDGRGKAQIHSACSLPNLEDSTSRRDLDGTRRDSNLPVFDLKNIIAATDNFFVANMLGKGGFGSVYKRVKLGTNMRLIQAAPLSTYVQNHLPLPSKIWFILIHLGQGLELGPPGLIMMIGSLRKLLNEGKPKLA
ncbi:g-type lectin s-receptor-like serine/threonine-protein kinase rks1 [Quercus suber]|uniref:G-type lectin s-receptor-like serine/threonine-protein kinase rks1 n=1 Tax=Quercus suber TaxID=58331 RepID=A0AAW0MDP8_QUESU